MLSQLKLKPQCIKTDKKYEPLTTIISNKSNKNWWGFMISYNFFKQNTSYTYFTSIYYSTLFYNHCQWKVSKIIVHSVAFYTLHYA